MIFPLLIALSLAPMVSSAPERFKDRIWLWCHVAGAHNDGSSRFYNDLRRQAPTIGLVPRTANRYRLKHLFTVTPRQAAADLGIENVMVVKYNIGPNPGPRTGTFGAYYDDNEMAAFDKVMWSLVGEGGATSPREQ